MSEPMTAERLAEWVNLGDLEDGAIFETEDGIKAVKSEYAYSNEPGSQCQCVLLESGEYAHFPAKNKTKVRRLRVFDESLQSQLTAERARVVELEAEREWISVEERLPELEVEVVLCDGKESTLGYLTNPDKLYDISIDIDWNGYVKEMPIREVTHWKPLPKPPEAK